MVDIADVPEVTRSEERDDLAQLLLVAEETIRQLQQALDSRIAIEQAKGMLAERHGLDVDVAFARLRTYARRQRLNLHQLAGDVVSGRVQLHFDGEEFCDLVT